MYSVVTSNVAEKVIQRYDDGMDKKFISSLRIINSFPVLFWLEKFALLVDYMQILSLLWISAQPWGLPYIFSTYSRPLLYFNLDFFSLTTDGAVLGKSDASYSNVSVWGQMHGYLNYALYFAIAQFLLSLLTLVLIITKERKIFNYYGYKIPRYDSMEFLCLYVAQILYLPSSLAVFRLYYCESDNHVLSADPAVSCTSPMYILYVILCTILCIPVFVGLPIILSIYINRNIIYRNSTDHEKKLQIWEILQMLNIDSYWLHNQIWLFSSFTLSGAYFRPHMLTFKALLLIACIFGRFNYIFQSTLFFCLPVLFFAYYCFFNLPFRSKSSNAMLFAVLALCIFNSAFAMMNGYCLQSAVSVASTESYILGLFNIIGLLVMLGIVVFSSAFLSVLDWPTLRTFRRITCSRTLLPKVSTWVEAIRESQILQFEYVTTPLEVADVQALEECIRGLRKHWLVAKSFGSLFESILGERLEDLLLLHAKTIGSALRRYSYWDDAYVQAVIHRTFLERKFRYATMTPIKRRILLKLLAIRFLCMVSGKTKMRKFDNRLAVKYSNMLKEYAKLREKLEQQRLSEGKGKKPGGQVNRNEVEMSEEERNLLQLFETGIDDPDYVMDYPIEDGLVHNDDFANFAWGGNDDDENDEENGHPSHHKGTSSHHEYDKSHPDLTDGGASKEGAFTPRELTEAAEMLATLKVRTEASLTKHHVASVNLKQWGGGMHASGAALASDSQSGHGQDVLTSHDSDRFTSFRVLKETVDQEERDELQELYLLWDEAIHLYEAEEFPGDYEQLNKDVESWYTYRSILSERLELVMHLLAEKQFDFSQIEAAEVIDEDYEEEEEEEEDEKKQEADENNKDSAVDNDHHNEDEDIQEDEDGDDFDYDDLENQLRAKYQQSKKLPSSAKPAPAADSAAVIPNLISSNKTLTRSRSTLDILGRPQSAQRRTPGSASFDYDLFGDASSDLFSNENEMLIPKK